MLSTRTLRHVNHQRHLQVRKRFNRIRISTCGPITTSRSFAVTPHSSRRQLIFSGQTTDTDESPSPAPTSTPTRPVSPFYLETGYAIFAKRPSRPFPPPFLSLPSHSFSDPLTTHQSPRNRKPHDEHGHLIGGITNGDDAVIIGQDNFVAVGDGVGAWAQKERGHAALWSRLVMHFWEREIGKVLREAGEENNDQVHASDIDMVACLQRAYDQTLKSTRAGEGTNEIMGTTTASGAVVHHDEHGKPVILATTLGDSMVYIIRPDRGEKGDAGSEEAGGELVYKTTEQWHWFDCPRQLGTNSPDTPTGNAVMDNVGVEVGDVVAVVSDGVSDNLFETEIIEKVCDCVKRSEQGDVEAKEGMVWVARELMNAAREIAQDPNAESPYMEKALDEGISAYGGKLDDISVVVGVCRRRET